MNKTVPEQNQELLKNQNDKINELINQVKFITDSMIGEVNKTIKLKKANNEDIKRQLKELYGNTDLLHQKLDYVTKSNQVQMDQIKVDIVKVIDHIDKISEEDLSVELQDVLNRNRMFIDKIRS